MTYDVMRSEQPSGQYAHGAGRNSINALVSLAPYISVPDWKVRHQNDEVPDATPYGLHKLADHGVVPVFAERSPARAVTLASKSAMRATGGLRLVEALSDTRYRRDVAFDVTLCYDEWNGIPAQAMGSRRAPVMMGVHFLSEPEQTPVVLRTAARRTLPSAAMVFTHTHTMAEILTTYWGVSADRVRAVPFGIDTDFYALQPQPETGGLVVSAGEDHLRDHALLVESMSILKRKDPRVRLELATGMDVHLHSSLGRVHHERLNGRMRDLYRRASVVAVAVHPSRSRASGSTVVLEAMASGRPVVATANPALAEFVIDGVTGILVPPGDPDVMAAAIGGLIDDPDTAAEMGSAGATYARDRFSSDVMARGLAELAWSL